MKIPDAKAAVDKEWDKREKIPAWQLDKMKSERDVVLEEQKDQKNVHFGTLMDIGYVKHAELEPQNQKAQR